MEINLTDLSVVPTEPQPIRFFRPETRFCYIYNLRTTSPFFEALYVSLYRNETLLRNLGLRPLRLMNMLEWLVLGVEVTSSVETPTSPEEYSILEAILLDTYLLNPESLTWGEVRNTLSSLKTVLNVSE